MDNHGRSFEKEAMSQAQDLMYEAWESSSPDDRVALARKALELSPDCADAYVLLADETANFYADAIDLYRKGVEAGERALGKRVFEEDAGHFWGLFETRPYMRARAGLAQCLWEAGRCPEAVQHYWDLLRLNPDDNQGLRDLLLPHLIEMGRDWEAEKLFQVYKDDGMAVWLYSRALLDFRAQGDKPKARKALKGALRENPHVPAYLLGLKRLPQWPPGLYGFGDANEAVLYAQGSKKAWKKTPEALEWLAAQADLPAPKKKKRPIGFGMKEKGGA